MVPAECRSCATRFEVEEKTLAYGCSVCGGEVRASAPHPLRARLRPSVPEVELQRACETMGLLRFFYFCNLVVLAFVILAEPEEMATMMGLYRVCMVAIMLQGFLSVTSRPLVWTLLAAVAQTAHVVRVFLAGDMPLVGMWWMMFLWFGVDAARRVEAVLKEHPTLRRTGEKLAWKTFLRWVTLILLVGGGGLAVLFLIVRF